MGPEVSLPVTAMDGFADGEIVEGREADWRRKPTAPS
jgi:hypothetical protein